MRHKEVVASLLIWGMLGFLAILDAGCPVNAPGGEATCRFFDQHSDILNPVFMALFFAAILSTFACILIPIYRKQLPS